MILAIVRAGSSLDDAQIQSVFHSLRHDFAPDVRFDRSGTISRVFDRTARDLDHNPLISPRRRSSLRQRLERARNNTSTIPAMEGRPIQPGLEDSTLYALDRLQARAATSEAALADRLTEIAGRRGMSRREAREEFDQLRAQAPGGRQPRITPAERAEFGTVMPTDPATRYALTQMAVREPRRPPMRLVDQWSMTDQGTEVGLSSISDRIEIANREEGTTSAWRISGQDGRWLDEEARLGGISTATLDAALRDGVEIDTRIDETGWAVRCDDCGRFVGNVPHDCVVNSRVLLQDTAATSDGATTLRAPDPDQVRQLVESEARNGHHARPVMMQIHWASNNAVVNGVVRIRPGAQVLRPSGTRRYTIDMDEAADSEDLRCERCHDRCHHLGEARAAARLHLAGTGELSREEAADTVRDTLLGARDRPTQPSATADQAGAPTFSFVDEPTIFREVILASGPDRQVDFHESDHVLTGYADNTQFGIELEFDTSAPQVSHNLVAANILSRTVMGGYHSSQRDGYRHWNLERDGSVASGGELVTPILSDTTDSWNQLNRACAAIRDGGGQTHNAGSHTNISAPDYTAENAWRLVNLIRNHEDDIYRMGRTRRSRRIMSYNTPVEDPGPRWTQQRDMRRGSRQDMLNLTHLYQGRIEWRFPDASHDPGVIQAQVRLCAAMTNFVRTNDVEPAPEDQRRYLGRSRIEGWTHDLMNQPAEQFAERTRGIRSLIDSLFDTDAARQQIAQLWGHGAYRTW